MKFAILFLLLGTARLRAEDATAETTKAGTATEANRAAQRNLETPQKAKKSPDETTITYSGFLIDLSHAEKKSRALSLRQPVDPKKDYKNLYFEERSVRPKGFILFALSF